MASRHRKKRLEAKYGSKAKKTVSKDLEKSSHVVSAKSSETFLEKYYKQLLIIPFALLFIALIAIGVQYGTTGEFINKGISLKGGTTFTVVGDQGSVNNQGSGISNQRSGISDQGSVDLAAVNVQALESALLSASTNTEFVIRSQRNLGEVTALIIEVDVTEQEELEAIMNTIVSEIPGLTTESLTQNMQTSSAVLGDAFFSQVLVALLVAFILMGIVVFIQFKVPVPSLAVILAAFSDIVITLAVVNIMGIKLGTAGIAAFLMLIGYSVDTDILLSTRVLKSKEGTVNSRIRSAMKTGLTMNITTLIAVTVALIFTQSQVIAQIMTILVIGLIVDMINTWIQNAGILRWYMEKRGDVK